MKKFAPPVIMIEAIAVEDIITTATDSIESYVARMSSSNALFEAILKFADAAYNSFH